jgi:hypothetical protein
MTQAELNLTTPLSRDEISTIELSQTGPDDKKFGSLLTACIDTNYYPFVENTNFNLVKFAANLIAPFLFVFVRQIFVA